MEKRKTLGNQLIDNYSKNSSEKGAETREISMQFAKKDFFPRIQKIVQEEGKKYKEMIYIQLFMWRDPLDSMMAQGRYIVRSTKPSPEPNCLCYSYNKIKDEWKYEWFLPAETSFDGILKNPHSYHPHMLENINNYKKMTASRIS